VIWAIGRSGDLPELRESIAEHHPNFRSFDFPITRLRSFSITRLSDHPITRSLDHPIHMPLPGRAHEAIRRQRLTRPDESVLCALSGGADSVALLFVLRELEAGGALRLAGAAHLNHQLRGADADADERFCRALCQRLGVPIAIERADVAALARAEKRSIEDAARSVRYAFLTRAADALHADTIAVAHTEDDQAETFLLRLMRGAGTRGLAAIRPRAGRVIRPLLEITRAELREYLAALGEPFREDASNLDVSFARNRVRHELIPLLQSRFSPSVARVLAREAALARQDEEFLAAEAIKLASRIVLLNTEVRLDVPGLRSAPRALSSRVAQAALQQLAGAKSIHFDHIERLLALADEDAAAGRAISLPGQTAIRVGNSILLRRCRPSGLGGRTVNVDAGLVPPASRRRRGGGLADERGPARHRPQGGGGTDFAVSLSIPGEVQLPGIAVGAERLPGLTGPAGRPTKWAARGMEVGIAAAAVELPLAVRSRRPGDRFRPLGAPGRRKLQDFLVDRKVPREERDSLPLVVDGHDRIVWVVGHSVAEDFRVTDPSQAVILLKVRHLGGVG
jgi:tRNA(Ile)-lysidine synthase